MNKPLKVLIIDDDEDDYFITSQYLKEVDSFPMEISWCYNIQEAKKELKSNRFDFYFLDYRLGALTGLELLEYAISKGCIKPIVLLTGKGNPEIDRKTIEAGAYDYLIKGDINAEKLERCVRYSTERYKTFKELLDKERKYRLIFENAINMVFTCDTSLHFLDSNKASEFFLGFSPEELKGLNLLNLIDQEQAQEISDAIEQKQSMSNIRIRFESKNKQVIIGLLSLNYFENGDLPAYWQGIIFDETLRIQAEESKIQTEKMEATYRLMNTLTHEIRNPLTNIMLAVDGVIDEGVNDNQKSYLEIAKRSSTRINEIVTDLLNSSRKIELKFESIDLKGVLQEVIQIAKDSSDLNQVEIRVDLCENEIIKPIDRDKLKIALLNLIFNGIEANDKEKGLINIVLTSQQNNAQLLIEDHGSGIKSEDLNKLFEPYFTTKEKGMGLGLVSTLNIIKAHKAKIEVSSQIGKGTLFKINFD
ncbi:MAG: response regulator [Crocinitomicaceae bacterium]|nr:response regulator [Crocinitomicaceae bacterium]